MLYWLVLHILNHWHVDLSFIFKVYLYVFNVPCICIKKNSKSKTDNYTNIRYNNIVLLRGIFIILFGTINIYAYITIEPTVCVLI